MKELEIIQKFEKDFIAAGKLAKKMRASATSEQKHTSGVKEIDIVTSADLAVQEYILERISKSKILKSCELLAEEETKFTEGFAKKSNYVITLDPIDGTYFYASGKKMYKVIVGINDKKNPLYTFWYCPEYDWGMKIVGKKCEFFGKKPKLKLKTKIPPKAITYGIYGENGDIKKLYPEIYKKLKNEGYNFVERKEISDEPSSTGQFFALSDQFAGFFCGNSTGSAVDILVALHFGMANGYEIIRSIDISKPVKTKHGGIGCYEGYYLILKK